MKKIFHILIFMVTAGIFASILPYPVLSNHTNITERDAYAINNHNETEQTPTYDTHTKMLSPDFDVIDVLLPVGSEFEIYDLRTETPFLVTRTGGKNHMDVEPKDESSTAVARGIGDFSWSRRPVLVKLNDSAYLPASLALYPHGFTSIDNNLNGHFCLHFHGSKTDGTKEEDYAHQRAIKNAKELGKKHIKNL